LPICCKSETKMTPARPLFDLDAAAAAAAAALPARVTASPGPARLLARAADAGAPPTARRAALRLLGAVAGEAFVGPRLVQLDVVGVCGANCVYCRDHSPYVTDREPWRAREMPFELAARLIREAGELGAELLPIVGAGETLRHSRFAELLELLKRQPAIFDIYTNGLDWTDRTVARFADAPNARVFFSLSAATPAMWAAFRPELAPEHFGRIEGVIARLVARRPPGLRVGVTHVLNRVNVREVLPMIRRAIELGVDEVQYKLTEINDAARPLKLGAAELHSIGLEMREARRLAGDAGVEIHDNIEWQLAHVDPETGLYAKGVYERTPCFAGFEMIRVRRDGAASFCCGLKFFGNLRDETLADHWLSEPMRAARRAALAMPHGGNCRLPDGGRLRDEQCDYCYNYGLNDACAREAREFGVLPFLLGPR
jgi:MoaA/NifB/PqqE/SkfB family radical SAM enzyme